MPRFPNASPEQLNELKALEDAYKTAKNNASQGQLKLNEFLEFYEYARLGTWNSVQYGNNPLLRRKNPYPEMMKAWLQQRLNDMALKGKKVPTDVSKFAYDSGKAFLINNFWSTNYPPDWLGEGCNITKAPQYEVSGKLYACPPLWWGGGVGNTKEFAKKFAKSQVEEETEKKNALNDFISMLEQQEKKINRTNIEQANINSLIAYAELKERIAKMVEDYPWLIPLVILGIIAIYFKLKKTIR
jgi:hypothetical protein